VFITVLLLYILFRNFDWSDFWHVLQKVSIWFYLSSLLVIFLGQLLYTLKWDLVLRAMGVKVPFGRLVQYYLIGIFFNNFLPTTIGGDGARVYYLGRQQGYLKIGGSVFMDRFLGFFSLTAFAAALSWTLEISTPPLILARNLLSIALVFFVVSLFLAHILGVDRVAEKIAAFDSRLTGLGDKVQRFLTDIKTVSRKYWAILGVMGIVFIYFTMLTWVYHTFFESTSGHQVDYWGTMTMLLSIGVLANVPLTVNGIGLREQLHYLLFASLGLPKEISVSISLLIFANILFMSLAGYILWIKFRLEKPVPMPILAQEPPTIK